MITAMMTAMKTVVSSDAPRRRATTSAQDDGAPRLTRKTGRGPFHFVLVPGMVPDGPETFLFQERVLRAHGSQSIITYPYERFSLDAVLATVDGELRAAQRRGAQPVLVGVSVGAGLCLELLRRGREAGDPLPVSGVMLMSPFTCLDDLAPLLKRLIAPIIDGHDREAGGAADAGTGAGAPEAALERGRAFFKTLASRSTGGGPVLNGWQQVLSLLTPTGIASLRERSIRNRIERTLDGIPVAGALERVLSLRDLPGIAGPARGPLTTAPTLILWGSKERHTLDMSGPGTSLLCRPDLAYRLFPSAEVHWVYDRDGSEVPHASLLKHARAFNPLIARWLGRQAKAHRSTRPFLRFKKA